MRLLSGRSPVIPTSSNSQLVKGVKPAPGDLRVTGSSPTKIEKFEATQADIKQYTVGCPSLVGDEKAFQLG